MGISRQWHWSIKPSARSFWCRVLGNAPVSTEPSPGSRPQRWHWRSQKHPALLELTFLVGGSVSSVDILKHSHRRGIYSRALFGQSVVMLLLHGSCRYFWSRWGGEWGWLRWLVKAPVPLLAQGSEVILPAGSPGPVLFLSQLWLGRTQKPYLCPGFRLVALLVALQRQVPVRCTLGEGVKASPALLACLVHPGVIPFVSLRFCALFLCWYKIRRQMCLDINWKRPEWYVRRQFFLGRALGIWCKKMHF